MNRIDRLTALLVHLQSKSQVPMTELEGRFEVSRRTLFRDIRSLIEAGVPIGGDAAVGYGIVKGYHLPPVVFNKQEAGSILLGAKMIEQTADQATSKSFQEALYKIKAVLRYADRDYLESLEKNISIIPNAQIRDRGFPDSHLTEVQQAIVGKNILELDYFSNYKEQVTSRNVEPLGIVFYSNRWHLIAYCQLRKGLRDFRTDRIKKIRISNDIFDPALHPNFQNFTRDMMRGTDAKEVILKFRKDVARIIGDQKYTYGFIEETELGGEIEMKFAVPLYEWIGRWLMQFGNAVTVVYPEKLKNIVSSYSKELFMHHKKSQNPVT
ncbi:MAG: YafY family protein [Cyclobacteriaceae bacterium]